LFEHRTAAGVEDGEIGVKLPSARRVRQAWRIQLSGASCAGDLWQALSALTNVSSNTCMSARKIAGFRV
jgi:hypothetical protein